MSEFGNYLKSHMKAHSITARELGGRMGIDSTLISGFITDKRKGCNPETLAKMVSGISVDEQVQAGLLEAYMRDQVIKEMRPWIKVQSQKGDRRVREEISKAYGGEISELSRTLVELAIDEEVVRAFQSMAKAAKAPKWRRHLVSVGELAADYAEGR